MGNFSTLIFCDEDKILLKKKNNEDWSECIYASEDGTNAEEYV